MTRTKPLTANRAALYLVLFAVVLSAVVIAQSNGGVLSMHYNVGTTDGRVAYLAANGWEADAATETEQTVILPRVFTGIFADYNALQRQQGFDLEPYAGLSVTVYNYRITNYDSADTVFATLYFYKNRIIAGDIHSTALDGFMHGIRMQ